MWLYISLFNLLFCFFFYRIIFTALLTQVYCTKALQLASFLGSTNNSTGFLTRNVSNVSHKHVSRVEDIQKPPPFNQTPNNFIFDSRSPSPELTAADPSIPRFNNSICRVNNSTDHMCQAKIFDSPPRALGRGAFKHMKKSLLANRRDHWVSKGSSSASYDQMNLEETITPSLPHDDHKISSLSNALDDEDPSFHGQVTLQSCNSSGISVASSTHSSQNTLCTMLNKSRTQEKNKKIQISNTLVASFSTNSIACRNSQHGCVVNGSRLASTPLDIMVASTTLFRSKAQQPLVSLRKNFTNHSRKNMVIKESEEKKENRSNVLAATSLEESNSEYENKSGLLPPHVLEDSSASPVEKKNYITVAYTPNDFVLTEESVTTYVLGNGAKPFPGKNIYVHCYPFNEKQIVEKCSAAKDLYAAGVYIPMMMEIQVKHERSWYAEIRRLKRITNLSVIGISYENPKWDLITDILLSNPQLFDGVLIEWAGVNACISNMDPPTVEQLEIVKEKTRYGILRYFVNEQNFLLCGSIPIDFVATHEYVSLKDIADIRNSLESSLKKTTGFSFPSYIQPVFGCMGGHEGFCFKAFRNTPKLACSPWQRYIFNPYEYVGGRMLHMLNESCHGLPEFDLYGVV